MHLKSKLAAIACALVLAAGVGVVLAGPAAASNGQDLCVLDQELITECAVLQAKAAPGVVVKTSDLTWSWNVPGSSGQISNDGGGGYCMWINSGVNSNEIVLEACNKDPEEEWLAFGACNPAGDCGTEYYNSYYDLCLNDRYYDLDLNAATCNGGYNQVWFPNTKL